MSSVMVVTGASRGIGAAVARRAAAAGYGVAVNYRADAAGARAVVHAIRDQGGRAERFQADVADEAQVRRLFLQVDAELGRPVALVNNAGVVPRQGPVAAIDGERLRRVFETNVYGTVYCCREAVRRMGRSGGGSGGVIVNVSSAASRLGSPGEYIDYAASKGAVDAFTRGLALEVAADGVRVNAVRPGFIATGIHSAGGEPDRLERVAASIPLQRPGQPEEVAEAVLWLCSDAAAYATGYCLDLAGGR